MRKQAKRPPAPKAQRPPTNKKIIAEIARYVGVDMTPDSRTLQESARFALSQKVIMTEGSETRKVTYQEAILTKYLLDSANDPLKLKLVMEIANGNQRMGVHDPIVKILVAIKNGTYSRPFDRSRELADEIEDAINGEGESK